MNDSSKRDPDDPEREDLAEGTLISHLIELRSRLLRAFAAVLVVFLCLVPFSRQIFDFVSRPLVSVLPAEGRMINTGIASPFLTPFKTTLFVAFFIAMPVVLYQFWRFVAPGLYRKEKRFAVPLLVSSIVLFYAGIAFAYFVVFRLVFSFFISVTPPNVTNMPDISEYLSFVLRIFFAFGLAFEVPIATFMLVWTRLVSLKTLSGARPYVFLGAFIVGMFLTPPDVFSQTLLAVPMYLLYEAGLILSRVLLKERLAEDAAQTEDETDEDDEEQ